MGHNCMGCHQDFIPRRNVPAQRFCGKAECQRKRRAQWQRRKLVEDADYREHQKKAKEHWRKRHREYMRTYRQSHPEYRERDRQQRWERHSRARAMAPGMADGAKAAGAVKMDACTSEHDATPIESGYYRLCRVSATGAVKMDAYLCGDLVQLLVVKENRPFSPVHGAVP